jgi:hypothetical protein
MIDIDAIFDNISKPSAIEESIYRQNILALVKEVNRLGTAILTHAATQPKTAFTKQDFELWKTVGLENVEVLEDA